MKFSRFRSIVTNYLTNGYQGDNETTYRIMLVNIIVIVSVIAQLYFSLDMFTQKPVFSNIADLLILSSIITSFFILRFSHNFALATYFSIIPVGIHFFLLCAYGGVGGAGYLWSFLYPTICIFTLGYRRGCIVTILFIFLIATLVFSNRFAPFVHYETAFASRYIGILVMITLITFIAEYTHSRTFRENSRKTSQLQHTVAELSQSENDRKLSLKALRESEERYRSLFEMAGDGILLMDDDTIIECNRRVCEMFGYSSEELIGLRPYDLSPETQPGGTYSKTGARSRIYAALNGQPQLFEWLHRRSGGVFHAEVSLNRIQIDGKWHLLAFVRDITDRKRSQQEQETLRLLIENTDDFIGVSTLDGRVMYLNSAGIRMVGLHSIEEARSKYIFDFAPELQKELMINTIIPIVQKHGFWKGQELLRHFETGAEIAVDIHVFAVKATNSSEPMGIATVMRDMTQEREIERRLRQSQKLEAIGTLAGGIAHDFNNILSAIIGYAELALMNIDEGTESYTDITEAIKASNRAKELVARILTFSRQYHEELQVVHIADIVGEAIKFIRASLPSTITISQSLPQENAYVMADPVQIHQILLNLCTNAAHAMRERGGKLDIIVDIVAVDAGYSSSHTELTEGEYVRIIVTDTGTGIPPNVLDRIFEPYFTTKKAGEGTGLGLAVIHGIVMQYRGTITVSSKVDHGTTFTLLLPKHDGTGETEPAANRQLRNGTERILIVDDERSISSILERNLSRLGYHVTAMTDPDKALALFSNDPDAFDIIISDMTMPGMTGDKMAGRMMEIRPDIPVILTTGYTDIITPSQAMENGIAAFLMKPLSIEDITRTIRSLSLRERN
jgi:PAS domain S-box-containing protein